MADVVISTATVWPSENDVCGSAGTNAGRLLREAVFAPHLRTVSGLVDNVISGLAVPTGATLEVTAGEALLYGYHVIVPSAVSVSSQLTGSFTYHLYLRLDFSSSLVTQAVIEINTSGTKPSYSIKLGTVTVVDGAYSGNTDTRPGGKMSWGRVTAAGATTDAGSQDWTVSGSNPYTITLTGHLRTPTALATPEEGSHFAMAVASSATSLQITTVDFAEVADESAFAFFAIG